VPRSVNGFASSLILAIALVVSSDESANALCGAGLQASTSPLNSNPLALLRSPKGRAVPASIDATGTVDASALLARWLETVPDGATIVFKRGGIYRMDRGLKLTRRRDLTLEGNGATLKMNPAATCGRDCSLVYLARGNRGISIRNFKLVGNNPTPGVYDPSLEQLHGITITASHDVEVANTLINGVGGDGIYVSGWSDGVWIHDSRVVSNGRMGIAVTAGKNVTVERVQFNKVGYGVFDIEPNDEAGGATNVRFVGNTIGSITMPYPKGFFFGANGAAGSTVNGVTVSDNTITGDALHTFVNFTRRQNIAITGNVSLVAGHGPILRIAHVDGLTISGNLQPLCSGTLARVDDSSNVTYGDP